MGEFLLKRFVFGVIFVVFLSFVVVLIKNSGYIIFSEDSNSIESEGRHVVFVEKAEDNLISGFAVHPLYGGFSSARSGFVFNNGSGLVSVNDNAVYRNGYFSVNGSNWQGFNFSGTSYNADVNWLTGFSSGSVPVFGVGEHYIIVYSCSYAGSSWDCNDNKWQLIVVNNSGVVNGSVPVCVNGSVVVSASSFEVGNEPEDAFDGNLSTRWSALGLGEWIQFGFGCPVSFNQVSISFASGDSRLAYFNISVSDDGVSWVNVYGGQSSGASVQLQNFSVGNVTASYLRVLGFGNSNSLWNSFNEVSWVQVVPVVVPVPNCSDGLLNGNETGVDCGGSCPACCVPSCSGKVCGNDGCGGSCGFCVNEHGSTSCSVGGLCVPVCSVGFGNCDSSDVNGCETVLGTISNCASCGNVCSIGQMCTGYVCTNSPSPVCGDGSCNGIESCSSCPGDCGSCPTGFLRTFYVSNSGSDSAEGNSPSTAWKTISKVNSYASFQPGDGILFRRGDTWREMLRVTRDGNAANYITFGAYGEGDNPRILGSNKSTGWELYSGNIWVSDSTFIDPYSVGMYGAEVFFENLDGTKSWGVHKTSIGGLTSEYNWYYSAGKIYIYSPSDPDTRYASVEIPQRAYIFDLNYKGYVHIDSIDMFYCGETGITYSASGGGWQSKTGLLIENLEIGYVSTKNSEAGYGTEVVYNNMTIRHCEIHNCGRRSISLHLYGSYTATNLLFEDNYFHDGFHTTGTDLSVGNGQGMHIDGVIIRRNLFYDSPTSSAYAHHIFLQNYHWDNPSMSSLKNVYIYSNMFISPTGAAINMEGTQSVFVYNNVFYNHNNGGSDAHIWIDNNNANVKIKNNIFYTSSVSDTGGVELFVRGGQSAANVDANYNLYYRTSNSLRIIEKEYAGTYYMNSAFPVAQGWEANGKKGNPLFVDASNNNFHLQSGSPAKWAGVYIPEVTTDYEGGAYNSSTPSIGAFEYI